MEFEARAGSFSKTTSDIADAFKAGIAPLGGIIYDTPDSGQKEMAKDVGNVDITGISHKEQFDRIFQMFGPDVVSPRFHGNDWGTRGADDQSFEAQDPEDY
ncbi:hypothetical protein FVER53590_03202 [Fusarium verticillioides]|nr:hypothetical protein FVER53590_03202 [Fusarium verticillioides]